MTFLLFQLETFIGSRTVVVQECIEALIGSRTVALRFAVAEGAMRNA